MTRNVVMRGVALFLHICKPLVSGLVGGGCAPDLRPRLTCCRASSRLKNEEGLLPPEVSWGGGCLWTLGSSDQTWRPAVVVTLIHTF